MEIRRVLVQINHRMLPGEDVETAARALGRVARKETLGDAPEGFTDQLNYGGRGWR